MVQNKGQMRLRLRTPKLKNINGASGAGFVRRSVSIFGMQCFASTDELRDEQAAVPR